MDAIGLRWGHAAIRTSMRRSSWIEVWCLVHSVHRARVANRARLTKKAAPRPQRRAEFAVTGEEMEHIVVPGDVQCDGIGALVKGNYRRASGASFVHAWTHRARSAILHAAMPRWTR